MLVEMALVAARRAEETLGAGAALGLVRAAAEAAEGRGRRTLLLAGLGIAVRCDDASAFTLLTIDWARTGDDESDTRACSLVARLADAGQLAHAEKLARAEIQRHRSPEALYALAVVLEREGLAHVAWIDAGPRGARAALAHAPPERADAAEAELRRSVDARDVLRLAPAALTSARLYARVRTLDRLLELGTTGALRIALAHADLRGASLSAIEQDRIVATAKRARAPQSILDALEGRRASRVDEAAARDALVGHAPASELGDRAATLALRALAAVARDESAALLLSALAAHPASPVGWTAVSVALASARSREAALACADRWMESGVAPPRGFATLSSWLDRAGGDALAERALAQAIRANEPTARERLAAILEQRAWDAYAAGDREKAKALIERSLAIHPDAADER